MGWFGHLQWGGSATPFKKKKKKKKKEEEEEEKRKRWPNHPIGGGWSALRPV
jgi:hypothetical protein